MLDLRPGQKDALVAATLKAKELLWIQAEIKAAYAAALGSPDDGFLAGEIAGCLARCDELGLDSAQDRLGFCFLDIAGFPGFRSLPQLPSIIAKCRESAPDAGGIMLELQRIAPPAFWAGLLERARPERERRGMAA